MSQFSDSLWQLDAFGQAALLRNGEVTPLELVDHTLDRIEKLNPRLNAVVIDLFDDARKKAADLKLDAEFSGVPILVKDSGQQIEGTQHFLGTPALRDVDFRSDCTTEFVSRLERAGFIVLGKTNVPELSSGITTEPSAFGPTRNPWDLERTPGGSSGGSAAAVAAGMVAVAHGSDETGSLRYPASSCGVLTLKPSRGRVPSASPAGAPDDLEMWTDFILARSARDLASILDVTANGSQGMAFLKSLNDPIRPLRVGLLMHDPLLPLTLDAACVEAVRKTGMALEQLGHHVSESYPKALDNLFGPIAPALNVISVVSRSAQVKWIEDRIRRPLKKQDLDVQLLSEAEEAQRCTPGDWTEAIDVVRHAVRPIGQWWVDGFDILITPTLRQPPWTLGEPSPAAFHSGAFTIPFSVTGQPALSVPVHWTEDGIPVGVQIVGAMGREDLLLHVAGQLELACPWHDRWPDIAN